jgi:4-hydroxythreonine-4-phosphate dehydrogenase
VADVVTTGPTLVFTPGEPAGIGPDLAVGLARRALPARLAVIADPEVLRQRAEQLGQTLIIDSWQGQIHAPGRLAVIPIHCVQPVRPGQLNPANARYVLRTLERAVDGCLAGEFDALVTGPVQKSVINDAGIPFTGHTEFLAARSNAALPVMMLAARDLRVALVTTHLPLSEVSGQITRQRLEQVVRVLHGDLRDKFGLPQPRIVVLGLNPHAGEGGHLGREEIDVISPVLEKLRGEGMNLVGPVPADTAFTGEQIARSDAFLAMYHDQGLPVLKHYGFGEAVNVTLGLPFIRTSVDHGTALDRAGRGDVDAGSLQAAIDMAVEMVAARFSRQGR